jgi:ABC-type Fe3+/spermidine/putrescine transport system ATPase subunit
MPLELDQLVAAIGDRRFGPISASLAPGSRLALLGPSGTGKTTLLRAIAGLGTIASGTVRIDGEDATRWAPERRRLAYLHQTPRLFPHLDVLGNVALTGRVAGDLQANAEARRWLAGVQLDAQRSAGVDALSGGERQRVALARALASRPRALLLDEPFTALDPSLRREIRDVVDRLLDAEGPAGILVTHDLDEAAAFAPTVVTLLSDRSVWAGEVMTLMHQPPTVALARVIGVENLVSAETLGSLVVSPAARTVGVRAASLGAETDPKGDWTVVRLRPVERGFRVDLESPRGLVVASTPEPLSAGTPVRLVVDPGQLLAFGPDGSLLPRP